MAWIESHQTLGRHPKVEKLARLLKIHKAQAIGHLHLLWWWCLDYAQDGSLVSLTNSDIAAAAGWTKQPDLFIEAMLTCGVTRGGFLERSGSGFVVHDWHQYAGRLIEKRRGDYERLKRFRSVTKPSDDTPVDTRYETYHDTPVDTRIKTALIHVSNEVTVPNQPTVPYPTNQSAALSSADETVATRLLVDDGSPSPRDLLRIWNENRGRLPEAKELNPSRSRHATARLKEHPTLEAWANVVKDLAASSWHTGGNDRGWVATFDFLVKPETFTKAAEGAYKTRSNGNGFKPTTYEQEILDSIPKGMTEQEALADDMRRKTAGLPSRQQEWETAQGWHK